MKKITLFLAFSLFWMIPIKGQALLDIFEVYGKRNNQIEKIICEALSTPTNKWKRTLVPIPEKYESLSAYTSQNDSKIKFNFVELHHAKHPNLRTLDDIFANTQKMAEGCNEQVIVHGRDGAVTQERSFCVFNIHSRDARSICYERITYRAKQVSKHVAQTNLLGERIEEIASKENEVIDETPINYSFSLLLDLGGSEFRRYTFWVDTAKPIPSEAEKTYLLQLFHYMEAQIKNVNA